MLDVNECQDVWQMSLLSGREEGPRRCHDAAIETTKTRHGDKNGDAPREHAHHSLRESHSSSLREEKSHCSMPNSPFHFSRPKQHFNFRSWNMWKWVSFPPSRVFPGQIKFLVRLCLILISMSDVLTSHISIRGYVHPSVHPSVRHTQVDMVRMCRY